MYGKYTPWGAALLLLCLLTSPLSATAADCSISDVTGSQDCIGPVSGNDDAAWFNTYGGTGAFDINTWMFAEKLQDGTPARETIIDVGLVVNPVIDGESLFGTWSLDSDIFDRYGQVAFALKAGPEFSAYHLLDGTSTTGTWDIRGWTEHGLSHFTVYVTAIPIPTAVWLFASGLVGLVAFSRRRLSA